MKNIILCIILFLAVFLRLYNLADNPPAAYGDEISFAWNAWNILKLGTDEYGKPFPLHFKAFGDYKSPIPVYLLVPVIKVLGMNTFAIRLPVAFFSILTIYILYLLAKNLVNEKIALISAFLLTISPWHIHLSRGYFESTMALFFLVTAVYFFILSKVRINYLYLSAIFFIFCLYTYFTPRIMLLLFLPFLLWWGKDWVLKNRRAAIIFLLIIFLLSLPLVYLSFFEKGLSRINELTSIRNSIIENQIYENLIPYRNIGILHRIFHNKLFYWIREIVNSYLEHFSINYLYIYGDNSLRYFIGNMGMFYLVELPFFILGLCYFFMKYRSSFWLFVSWLLIAPIPAAISGRPFAVRSLAMLPSILVITAGGFLLVWNLLKTKTIYNYIVKLFIVILLFISFGYYFIRYHKEYNIYAATWWGWENKAAIDLVKLNQDKYDKIFISNFYTGMDLAMAYYFSYDPLVFKKAKENPIVLLDNRQFIKLGKFYIGSLDIDDKRKIANIIPPNSLYIGRPEEADSKETINAPNDGRIIFKIYRN